MELKPLAERLAKKWQSNLPESWEDLRHRVNLATGGELDCQPLDILTDMVKARLPEPDNIPNHPPGYY